jgi:hypothetical protein
MKSVEEREGERESMPVTQHFFCSQYTYIITRKNKIHSISVCIVCLNRLGCLLIHPPSKTIAAIECQGLEIMLRYLEHPFSSVQIAALETLLSMLVDCDQVQSEFRKMKGIDRVVALLKNKNVC